MDKAAAEKAAANKAADAKEIGPGNAMPKQPRKADTAAKEFVAAVAQSMDELEKRIVEVTGIEGDDDEGLLMEPVPGIEDDDDGLVVGRVTFSPEVERIRKRMAERDRMGMMPGPDGEGCVRTPTGRPGPLNKPFDEVMTEEELLALAVEVTPHKTPYKPAVSRKETNPKDAVGTKKWRQYCTVPTTVIWELGVAMLEGARKYGRHNYRIAGVRASVYIDAAKGHIDQWWEGEDTDEESKLNHIVKAIATLVVLRDAMIHNKWVDDRPPKTDLEALRADLQVAVDGIFERIPNAKDAYLEGDQYDRGHRKV